MDGLQRREQGFQAVCQRDGRRRVGQKERARHEHDDAQHQEARVDKALPRDLEDPELHQHIALGIKYVDDSGKNDDKQQRLQALEQRARANARQRDCGDEKREHDCVGNDPLCKEQRHDVDDDHQQLCARVKPVDDGVAGKILAECDVFKHGHGPPAARGAAAQPAPR